MARFTMGMANPTKFHLAVLGMGCIGVAHFAISLFAWALLLRIPRGIRKSKNSCANTARRNDNGTAPLTLAKNDQNRP